MPTHYSEKNPKCKYCDKAFSDRSHLNRHMKTHNSEKNHKCKYCDKAFSDSSNLNRLNTNPWGDPLSVQSLWQKICKEK